MVDFAVKMMMARSVAKGEKSREEAAKEVNVAEKTIQGWVRAYKTAALSDHFKGGVVQPPPVVKSAPKKKSAKPKLPEPQVQEATPTKSAPVKAKEAEDEWDII